MIHATVVLAVRLDNGTVLSVCKAGKYACLCDVYLVDFTRSACGARLHRRIAFAALDIFLHVGLSHFTLLSRSGEKRCIVRQVILCQHGARHRYALARILEQQHRLKALYTDSSDHSMLGRVATFLDPLLPVPPLNRLAARRITGSTFLMMRFPVSG